MENNFKQCNIGMYEEVHVMMPPVICDPSEIKKQCPSMSGLCIYKIIDDI